MSRPTDPRQVVRDGPAAGRAGVRPAATVRVRDVALLGWLLGPVALIFFAGLGFAGYAKARRAGLLRSRCKLGDTRLVLVWLVVVAAGAACGGPYVSLR